MERLALAGTDLEVSRFSFGTGSLHHLSSAAERETLLRSAVELGFTHFDTAPLYGFGLAEESLGRLGPSLARAVTVATKVGLYPPRGASARPLALRLRKGLGRVWPALSRAVVDWSLARAEASLAQSLRRLGRERVDVLFLHEASAELLASDEWRSWLEAQRRRGSVRAFGVAGELAPIRAWLEQAPRPGLLVQVRDSLQGREAEPLLRIGRPPHFAYGLFSAGESAGGPRASVDAVLRRLPQTSILVATRRRERLREYARAGDSA